MGRLIKLLMLAGLAAGAVKAPKVFDEWSQPHVIESDVADIHMNPIMGKLLEIPRSKKERRPATPGKKISIQNQLAGLTRHQPLVKKWAFWIPVCLFSAGFLLVILGFRGPGRSVASLCHAFSRKWLFVFSGLALLVYFWQKVNLWGTIPAGVWSWPVLAVLASAGLLKAIDANYPIWNGTVKSLLAPISVSLVITIGQFL